MDWNMLYSNVMPPTWEQVTEYIGSPLWADFNERIQSAYQVKPCMEHSRCSMQAGWNIKYKKKRESPMYALSDGRLFFSSRGYSIKLYLNMYNKY